MSIQYVSATSTVAYNYVQFCQSKWNKTLKTFLSINPGIFIIKNKKYSIRNYIIYIYIGFNKILSFLLQTQEGKFLFFPLSQISAKLGL